MADRCVDQRVQRERINKVSFIRTRAFTTVNISIRISSPSRNILINNRLRGLNLRVLSLQQTRTYPSEKITHRA